MIINPTPITPATFAGMWITSLQIFTGGKVQAALSPYDGEHLLATGTRRTPHRAQLLPATLATLTTGIQRLSGKTEAPKLIQVSAPDPANPVSAQIIFPTGGIHRIPDCYSLAGEDAAFAAMFASVMAEVAQLAGLTLAG